MSSNLPYDVAMADPLTQIRDATQRQRQAITDRDAAMRAARDAGHTWASIAEAAGLTPHGVRYALGYSRKSTGGE